MSSRERMMTSNGDKYSFVVVLLLTLMIIALTLPQSADAHAVNAVNSGTWSDLGNGTQATSTDHVKTVHIVFMNHLDVGYGSIPGGAFINRVLWYYFHVYFPRAAQLATNLTKGEYTETFIYTTHPWLVTMYLSCPPDLWLAHLKLQCPNATEVAQFREAIRLGYITWHAGPMNLQSEYMDQSLYEFSLSLSQQLDQAFNIKRKYRVLSQRDVPGMTQAVIPSLVKMGISAVSVGVNPMTAPPDVPQIFRWQYGHDEVIATYHPGGYPANPGPDPANPGGISVKDCVVLPNLPDALCFGFRTDNSGPPVNLQELLGYYEIFRKEFPKAELKASKFEDFIEAVQPIKSQLPIITKEIGDTWITGDCSDPRKTAEFRAVTRVFAKCIADEQCKYTDQRFWNASRLLSKVGEHTWGHDSLNDNVNWTNVDFYKASGGVNYKNVTLSWLEQRNITYYAMEALGNHSVKQEVYKEMRKLTSSWPDLDDYVEVETGGDAYNCTGGLSVQIGLDGALSHLGYKGRNWASSLNPLGKFIYSTYNEGDFDSFSKQYDYITGNVGIVKRNLTVNAHPVSHHWPSALTQLFIRRGGACSFYGHMQVIDRVAHTDYGAPADIWIHYTVRYSPLPGVDMEVELFDKTSTRLPEALHVSFEPVPQSGYKWQLSKLGRLIDPLNVILNGSQYQHAVDDQGVFYKDTNGPSSLQFIAWDVPVASLFTREVAPTVFPVPLQPISSQITGAAFNLFNNIWDTNFIFWYPYIKEDRNFKSRYSININSA